MNSTYAAHIVTTDAAALGDPEIIVMTQADEHTGAADLLIAYPLPDRPDGVPVTLHSNGWRIVGEATSVEPGYSIVDVEPVDWTLIVKAVKHARASAQAELDRQDTAYRTIIGDAMRDDSTNKTAISEVAGISRGRAYQIRDGL